MHTDYRSPLIKQLRDQQIKLAPRDKRIEQTRRTEALLAELDPNQRYSYEYIWYRVTDYRPDTTSGITLTGKDAHHDLRLLVEDVSDSVDLQLDEAAEPVLTVEELSKRFNVSTKTISRWRQQGLISRRFVMDGRKRVGFLLSSVERFVTENQDRVQRGERFSQLTDDERGEIIERARRLSRAGGCPAEVTRRIAKYMDRSVETIRYTLKQFDEKHPELAIFPDRNGPLSEDAKRQMYQRYRRGISVESLAKQYCRTKTSVYRVLNEMRARRILSLPLDYIDNPIFNKKGVEAEILGPMPEPETTRAPRKTRPPAGLPPYLASLYETALLSREQEYHLFRKFNYLKYKASKLRDHLCPHGKVDPTHAKSSVMDEIERLYDMAVKVKNQIVQANLRLVVSIAKRHVTPSDDFFNLVSDGNMSLIRAVEKFDYSRGNKFSTYASWAIMKNFARTIPEEYKLRERFKTSQDDTFTGAHDPRTDQVELEHAQQLRETQVNRILSRLDEREASIIVRRFGLDHHKEPQTLKEVGEEMGVTKERVRQIEARALSKMRQAAKEDKLEPPE
jgi:RNA polymerase primary sigma factor/RNA polymerase sigma factor